MEEYHFAPIGHHDLHVPQRIQIIASLGGTIFVSRLGRSRNVMSFRLLLSSPARTGFPFPYAVGKNITEGMRLPEGAEPDQYEVTLKYKNKQTGEVQSFTEENYPWQDTLNWEYESSSERLVKKGYITPTS